MRPSGCIGEVNMQASQIQGSPNGQSLIWFRQPEAHRCIATPNHPRWDAINRKCPFKLLT